MGSVVSSVVGGIFGDRQADKAADAQTEAAMIAAEQFRPYQVDTDYGMVRFSGNGRNKRLSASLTGDAKAMADLYGKEGQQSLDEAASQRYGQLEALSKRAIEDTRRENQEYLFRTGRAGTYSGMRRTGEVETALANARLSRELASYDWANQLRQQAVGNYLNITQGMTGALGALSLNRNPAAPAAAMGIVGAGQTQAGYQLGLGSAVAQGAGKLARASGFDAWAKDAIGSIFSPSSDGVGSGFSTDYGSMFI